jgi:hypothetical protein
MDWNDVDREKVMGRAVVGAEMNVRVRQNEENFLTGWGTVSF